MLPWLVLAVLAVPTAPQAEERTRDERPNVVLILADDLGLGDVGFQGSRYPTPSLDRMAAEGLVFERAYAAAPSCSPTRAALLTGKSPARLGLTRAIRNKDYLEARKAPGEEQTRPRARLLDPPSLTHLPEGERTVAERLRAAGYATGFVGKWHLGEPPFVPESFGFESSRSVGYYAASPYFPPYLLRGLGSPRPADYLTDQLTEEALAFVRQNRERPFFLYLAHFAVHGPWQAKPELVERLRHGLDPDAPQGNPTYAAMIASLDESVGRILAELDALDLAERTLVLFLSDNGPNLASDVPLTSAAPLRGQKLDLYEGGLRVPFVARWKGVVRPGTHTSFPTTSMDVYPTLLALCGLEREAGEAPDGQDLSPLLAGQALAPRPALHFFAPHGKSAAAILAGPEKLIHFFGGASELYDLGQDIGEAHDLAQARPERARELETKLFAWLEASGAALPRPNPHHDPSLPPLADEED